MRVNIGHTHTKTHQQSNSKLLSDGGEFQNFLWGRLIITRNLNSENRVKHTDSHAQSFIWGGVQCKQQWHDFIFLFSTAQ